MRKRKVNFRLIFASSFISFWIALLLILLNPLMAQQTPPTDEDAEREILQLLNQARREQGLKPLANDDRLVAAARKHSQLMAEQHVLSHGFPGEPELPQRLDDVGIRFDRSGENASFAERAADSHDGLMHSPPHRANILNQEFNAVGIGVVQSKDGLLWVTQDFVRRLQFLTTAEAETMLARKFEQLRRASGESTLLRASKPQLNTVACQMARSGNMDTRAAIRLVGQGSALAFNTADISNTPQGMERLAAHPGFDNYAIGVCFEKNNEFPSGGYWAVILMY